MASLIPQDFIRDLIVQTDIVTLIDSYVPLKKKGKDHWGLCPFHHDVKTPSFSVSPQKQFFYCFTCKKTGNAIGFIQDHLRMTFVESVEVLASKIGVEVPYSNLKNNSDERRLLLEILGKASNFFETNLLNHDSAETARLYLKNERKLSPTTCKQFKIGYALNSWGALSEFLVNKGYKKESIIQAGLSKENKDLKLFDVFRDRIMFPIRDTAGNTVGFGGRVMKPEDQPKYLNTSDTLVFKKSSQVYGLYESSSNRKDMTEIFVVEGYLDVVSMFQRGINNAVATLGIASNRFHTQKLLQLTDKIIFCFDGDKAGRGAAWNALKNSLPVAKDEAELRFLFLPEGEDPASLLEVEDKDIFMRRMKESLVLSDFFIKRLKEVVGSLDSLEKKASLASKAMTLLHSMPDCVLKDLLEIEISKSTGLDKKNIHELSLSSKQNFKPITFKQSRDQVKNDNVFELSSFSSKALKTLIQYPNLSNEVGDFDRFEGNTQPDLLLLLKIANHFKNIPDATIAEIMSILDKDETEAIGNLLANSLPIKETNISRYFQDCLIKIENEDSGLRILRLKKIMLDRSLTEDEIFELQQHLISNLDELSDEDKSLLRSLS